MQSSILQKAKGVRDFGAREKILRDKIIKILKTNFELFGYNPIETPIIERYELFASKYGIGQESDAMRETFKFNDQGKRDLVLRTEFTVPFARFIGSNQQLKFPFKRYQIGQVFRDGPLKLGRYREFWQCDVDIVGLKAPKIDAEILQLIKKVFLEFNLDVEIQLNNRKVLNSILKQVGIKQKDYSTIIVTLDKLDKIGRKGVTKELLEKEIDELAIENVLDLITVKGTNQEILSDLKEKLDDVSGLEELENTLKYAGKNENIRILPSLARGLAYYTGNIFEVVLKDQSKLESALLGGGRYDEMISGFLNAKDKIPAIGVSFGLDTIYDALIQTNNSLVEEKDSITEVYVIPMHEDYLIEAMEIGNKLRNNNIKVDIDVESRKMKKAMDYANSYKIPWVLILGENEIAIKEYSLKNMDSGMQYNLSLEKIVQKIKDQ